MIYGLAACSEVAGCKVNSRCERACVRALFLFFAAESQLMRMMTREWQMNEEEEEELRKK